MTLDDGSQIGPKGWQRVEELRLRGWTARRRTNVWLFRRRRAALGWWLSAV